MRKVPALLRTIGVVVGFSCCACSVLTGSDAKSAERPPFRLVRAGVAFEIMRDTPSVPILDVRAASEFMGEKGHIRWSINMPLDQLDERLGELIKYKAETLLLYCDDNDCAGRGAMRLQTEGFEQVIVIDGGIDRWLAGGFGTVRTSESPPHDSGANGASVTVVH